MQFGLSGNEEEMTKAGRSCKQQRINTLMYSYRLFIKQVMLTAFPNVSYERNTIARSARNVETDIRSGREIRDS